MMTLSALRAGPATLISAAKSSKLHIICERDAGLFSLIQAVISHIPCALREGRTPVALFQERTCYWTPNGHQGRDTVWEYYFEPLVPAHPASSVSEVVRRAVSLNHPLDSDPGYFVDEYTFVSSNFGDHPDLAGKSLAIPRMLHDPGSRVRREAGRIVRAYVRPRAYIREKADRFFDQCMKSRYVIGVHIRGTDAVTDQENPHRHGSLRLPSYVKEIERLLQAKPDASIFVASDAQSSVETIKDAFGSRVMAYDSLRHLSGEVAGAGPMGWVMPRYISQNREQAARNGEEAVVEYLLLSRCNYLVHNGSSLARTVLLKAPELPHLNTYAGPPPEESWTVLARARLSASLLRLRNSPRFTKELFDPGQFPAGWPEWHRSGDVPIAPGSGEARVTVHDTLMRNVPVDDSVVYRYSLQAFCDVPGKMVRLQINWHDASGNFIDATIEPRQCGPRWHVYTKEMKPPAGARTGIVIVGGHTEAPVLVRSVSLRLPIRGE